MNTSTVICIHFCILENIKSVTDSLLSNTLGRNTRYLRRAKNKAFASYCEGNSSDDDFSESSIMKNFVATCEKKKNEVVIGEKKTTERKAILIEPIPNHLRERLKLKHETTKTNNDDDADVTADCILSDDDDVQPAKKRKVNTDSNNMLSKIKNTATNIYDYMSSKGKRTSKMVYRPNIDLTDEVM